MSDEIHDTARSAKKGRPVRLLLGIGSAVLVAGLVAALVVGNVAIGQTENSDPPPMALKKGKMRGFGGTGFGKAGPIHGEFVAPRREGGFVTYAIQRGETTAVNDSSITVRSEDGYSRTYAVNGDTRVNRDGRISDIKNGAKVGVFAVVEGGNARAVRIVDEAFKQQMRDRMREKMRERRQNLRPGSFEGAPPPLSG